MQRLYELTRDETPRTMAWYADDNEYLAHFHSTVEIIYVECGVLCAMQDGATILVPKNHLIVNSSYMLHSYSTPESSRIIVCTIPLGAVPSIRQMLSQRRFARGVAEAQGMEEAVTLLRLMADPAHQGNAPFINALGEALLSLLIEKIGLCDNSADQESDLMKRILIYLQEHATEPITVADAAAHFGYSTGRFSHIFNERIGCPFTRYVNSLRCTRAKQLLLQSDLSLMEIAAACGFASIRTFHRVYKAHMGQTPRQAHR